MESVKEFFTHWSVATKQVALFCLFGLIPMLGIGFIAINAAGDLEDKAGQRFQETAVSLADKIDRSLFERYGDAQVFGLNEGLQRVARWYDPTSDNAISTLMDGYVAKYGIYSLTILVDTSGDVVAVNQHDAQGNPINYDFIFKKNYKDAPWFQALVAQEYTTSMPFTAEGNDVSTGTFIEDLHVDPDVKEAYPGNDGLTIAFSAPVYNDIGEVIAYWSNRTKFSLVEEMFTQAYQGLKEAGFPGSELTLLDGEGRIIIDYDPTKHGTEDVVHDMEQVILQLNLAEKGVAVAQKAVAGETGSMYSLHARKQIEQAAGFTHLQGALGYPGMNWSVLVRVPKDEAVAEATAIQWKVMMTGLICLAVIVPFGLWIGRRQARGLIEVSNVAQVAAQGDLTQRVPTRTKDELGTLANAMNEMFDNVGKVVNEVRQAAEHVTQASGEISQGNEDLSQRTSQQASSLEETSASMEQMTSTVKQNADNAKQANQLAMAAREVAEKGGAVTSKAVEAMNEINKSSKKIADIINVIDEIAFQTNLLALNAAVEAARAGEQGRGFAVVASEVRNLAQRSATAAKEIKDHIQESVQRVEEGSGLVGKSGKTLDEIVTSVKRVTDLMSEMSAASQEQASGIDQVNQAIMEMDHSTQQNAALVEEAASSAQSMSQQAAALQQQVQFFKLTHGRQESMGSVPRMNLPPKSEHKIPMGKSADQVQANTSARTEKSETQCVGTAPNSIKTRAGEGEFEEF